MAKLASANKIEMQFTQSVPSKSNIVTSDY